MQLISDIEIKYFRSIYKMKISNLSPLNIFSGSNDAGKSNILKALNLFFNNHGEWNSVFDFTRDFSYQRKEEVKKNSIKGKQFISVTLMFKSQGKFPNTLPDKFSVTKTWLKDEEIPRQTDNLEALMKAGKIKNRNIGISRRSLTGFLRSIKYTYVPAIKDVRVFEYVLQNLQDTLLGTTEKTKSVFPGGLTEINEELSKQAIGLSEDFFNATGIGLNIALPTKPKEIFQALHVNTNTEIEGSLVKLDQRGDGIRLRFIPTILNYIASRSKAQHIWGFEEPENSMEYKKAFDLYNEFEQQYSKKAQIFVTSHSPAFISASSNRAHIFRVYAYETKSKVVPIKFSLETGQIKFSDDMELADELGHTQLLSVMRTRMNDEIEKLKAVSSLAKLIADRMMVFTKPVLLTEGEHDVDILESAWNKLFAGKVRPFEIKSCDTIGKSSAGSAAGCDALARFLRAVLPDSPHKSIGLFDRDMDGKNAFKLDKNFLEFKRIKSQKVHKNKKAYAFLMPIPPRMDKFDQYNNLPIEFLFDEKYLRQTVNGKGLILKPEKIKRICRDKILGEEPATELFMHTIVKESKKDFAKEVVPTLPPVAFESFRLIFQIVEVMIRDV